METVSYEDVEPVHMRFDAQYDVTITYTAWNEDVKIAFPDFSGFEEISEEEYAQ